MSLRKYIPKSIRLTLKQSIRWYRDIRNGYHKQFARPDLNAGTFEHVIELRQPIRTTALSQNKIKNILKGGLLIEQAVIYPGEIFSFWRMVGKPSRSNGYEKGRNIVNGELRAGYGGGLCQLASIVYHTSLLGGLETIERHNHSMDLYEEEERYTPLGADATVVFGYKDLRIRNNLNSPIQFHFAILGAELICQLTSLVPLQEQQIEFRRIQKGNQTEVITEQISPKGDASTLTHSRYTKWVKRELLS